MAAVRGSDDDTARRRGTRHRSQGFFMVVVSGDGGGVMELWMVCDARHSELIPCLDRRLHYQLRLRLNLSLMEHYERHCPPAPRRLNCLIPPPVGYQDSFRNVMDMSANLEGFAASLKKKDVWVMNVVPFTESGKLKITV
ncbi:unnamed protein product [Miscanthus lutarioriparius]|uniref:Methyltransferase n=1 Tax=Miscanthus lutarioriparius TaxID=422564 RepID=A0A811N975_9POAL|nr:unnamed protein product [Miscanthus lutarioriparius]